MKCSKTEHMSAERSLLSSDRILSRASTCELTAHIWLKWDQKDRWSVPAQWWGSLSETEKKLRASKIRRDPLGLGWRTDLDTSACVIRIVLALAIWWLAWCFACCVYDLFGRQAMSTLYSGRSKLCLDFSNLVGVKIKSKFQGRGIREPSYWGFLPFLFGLG